jgi:acyl-coenzyme A synthetase/AMP-(fatty) acid ligase
MTGTRIAPRPDAGQALDAGLPLLAPRGLDAPLAWSRGAPISARRFLADVRAQAACMEGAAPVANLCANRYRFAVVLAAAWTRGAPSLLPPNALPDTLARLAAAWPGLVLATDGDEAVAGGAPRLALAACALDAAADAGPGAHPHGPADAATLAAPAAADAALVPPLLAPALSAAWLFTSGSTGEPQPHPKRWGALVHNAHAGAERLAALAGLPDLAGLAIVATVPPQHCYGLESSVMIALQGGAAFDAARPYYPADIAAALARVPRPRALVTTPFHLRLLLQARVDLPPADFVLSATAPLSPQLARAAEERFAAPLLEIYGSTETCQVAVRRTARGELWHTFGALQVHAGGAPATAAGGAEPGTVRFWASGGHLEAPTPLADLLELEDSRHFRLLGRASDIVQVAGKRSSLAHLDYHLNSLPGVRDGAFFVPEDVPDAAVRTLAFVVAPGVDAAAIRAGLRARIDPAFLPRRIVFVDALPRAASGKLARAALAGLARRTAVPPRDGGEA